jgi:hypothetical protein
VTNEVSTVPAAAVATPNKNKSLPPIVRSREASIESLDYEDESLVRWPNILTVSFTFDFDDFIFVVC